MALPLIEIAAVADPVPLVAAWSAIGHYDAVLFVSVNAVEYFFAVRAGVPWPAHTRLYATGPGSVAALLRAGADVALIDAPPADAAQFDSEALWRVVAASVWAEFRLLVVRGSNEAGADEDGPAAVGVGRDWFANQVRAQGGAADFLVAYERRAPQFNANALALLQVAAQDGSVWLFSSSEAVTNLCSLASGQSWARARAVATHPRIAQTARDYGFGTVCESRPQMADLIASIESLP
jgi:uroporphyrinogen-III synthase